MPQIIKYQTDSTKGPEFQMISRSQGWVEYLNTLGQVYYLPQLSQEYYNSRRQILISSMPSYTANINAVDYLGWIQHLAQQRLLDKFVLPVFGSINTDTMLHVQCGNSRIDANIMCGLGPEEIPMIAFSSSRMHIAPPAERLQSTQQFNDIFKLDNIDYKLVFDSPDSAKITFLNSILRYTTYEDSFETTTRYSVDTFDCMSFWKKFQSKDSQFKIQIHCTPETRSHVVASNLFKVEYIDKKASEWEISYGMMLGAFNKEFRNAKSIPTLELWLYDVTEPVNLELLVPWMSSQHNFYKTQNDKAVIIYGDQVAQGLQVIGNWVK